MLLTPSSMVDSNSLKSGRYLLCPSSGKTFITDRCNYSLRQQGRGKKWVIFTFFPVSKRTIFLWNAHINLNMGKENIEDFRYLVPNRLSDIIRLIIVLARDKYFFRSVKGIEGTLRDIPQSGPNWMKVAKEHPEFFRFSEDGTLIVLLIRFFKNTTPKPDELVEPLTVEETQKLVDQAIALHDKQLARYQRNSFRMPFYGTLIASGVSLFISIIGILGNNNSLRTLNKDTNIKLDSIKQRLDVITQKNKVV